VSDSDAHKADLSALKIDRGKKSGAPGRGKKWLHLLWLLLPIVLYFGYKYTIREVTPSVKARTTTVQLVTGSEAIADLVATGYVVAQVKAAVSSKATGRLRVLNVEEGDSVKAGEVVAELENDDIKADLDVAKANLKMALADSIAADLNFYRQKDLYDKGLISQEEMEIATATFHRAIATVEARAAAVKAAEVALDNTIIVAPFNGTVLRKDADVGEMVAPFASTNASRGAVVTMADMSSLEVEADVSESNIQKVIVGQPCEIILDAYPDYKYAGYVKKIVPTADRSKATVMVKVAFKNIDSRVLPEMSARVNFLPSDNTTKQTEMQPVLAVNKDALTMREGRQVAFKYSNGIVQQTPVETGRQLGKVTEIISGLNQGDTVVLSPSGGLKSGDKIEITN
jgi:RND family efflux transporter MFP subunit